MRDIQRHPCKIGNISYNEQIKHSYYLDIVELNDYMCFIDEVLLLSKKCKYPKIKEYRYMLFPDKAGFLVQLPVISSGCALC